MIRSARLENGEGAGPGGSTPWSAPSRARQSITAAAGADTVNQYLHAQCMASWYRTAGVPGVAGAHAPTLSTSNLHTLFTSSAALCGTPRRRPPPTRPRTLASTTSWPPSANFCGKNAKSAAQLSARHQGGRTTQRSRAAPPGRLTGQHLALTGRHLALVRAVVAAQRPDEVVVLVLFHDVCRPPGDPGGHEQRGESLGVESHQVVGRARRVVQIRQDVLAPAHLALQRLVQRPDVLPVVLG